MAATGLTFAAQVDAWCRESEERLTAVFRESTKEVVSIAQETLASHVDTGFLRASVRGSTSSMPQIEPAKDGKAVAGGWGDIYLVIAGAQLGQTVYVGWTAFYAPFVEYGTAPHDIYPQKKTTLHWFSGGKSFFSKHVHHPGTRPVAFVRGAAVQWPQIVARNIEKAKLGAS